MKDVKDDHMLGQIGLGAKRGFAVLNKTFTAGCVKVAIEADGPISFGPSRQHSLELGVVKVRGKIDGYPFQYKEALQCERGTRSELEN